MTKKTDTKIRKSIKYDEAVLILKRNGKRVLRHTRTYTGPAPAIYGDESHEISFKFRIQPAEEEEDGEAE